MSDRSRSPRRAQTCTVQLDLAEAIREAPRAKLVSCLLKCLEAGKLPEDVRSDLLPHGFASMLREKTKISLQRAHRDWREVVSADSLPSSIFGSMLCQKTKTSLQRTNREWRDVVRMPSFWRELSCKDFEGSTQELLASLEDPRFAQVESFRLPEDWQNELTLELCWQIRQRLPRIAALDASLGNAWQNPSALDTPIEGFAPLLHLRLGCVYFGAEHFRTVLRRHEQLRVFENAGGGLVYDLATRSVRPGGMERREDPCEFPTHSALEVLSLFDHSMYPSQIPSFLPPGLRGLYEAPDFPTACDELVRRVLTKLPSLTRLCLNGWFGISEANVSAVIQACPKLTELRLENPPDPPELRLEGERVGDGHHVVTRPSDHVVWRPSDYLDSWKLVPLPGQERHVLC